MGQVTATPELIQRARMAGACEVPEAGTPIDRLTFKQLVWIDSHGLLGPTDFLDLRAGPPVIWGLAPAYMYAGSGSGYGYDSDGYGDGYDGYGYDGYGPDGDGDSYGYDGYSCDGFDGYGSSSGYGYGYGSGCKN